jgi:ATP-dependent DNA helicase RecQ
MTDHRALDAVLRIARERFGFETLRPGQQDAILSVLANRDTLVVMPTGAGKSAIYQIPAVALAGPTVVVSPLIALQHDQAGNLADQPVGGAAVVNSLVPAVQRREAFEHLEAGALEFIFLAPEQLQKEAIVQRLGGARPSLFVVDEAHCISEWGHDFRPDYLKLQGVIEALGHPTVLALTATAAPRVREEIVERLGMREPRVIVRGFNRPNIWLGVETFSRVEAKTQSLIEHVLNAAAPGIVYVATRRHAEEISEALNDEGLPAVCYHGGMGANERQEIQDDFMQRRAPVIVATSAFGMGVDKPDVRFVFHYDVSDSLDAYAQETGRAGRDGKEAKAVLLYRPQDLNLHKFFAGGGQLNADELTRVAAAVQSVRAPLDLETLREETGLSKARLARAVNRLQAVGAIKTLRNGVVTPAADAPQPYRAADAALREQQHHHAHELLRLERMRGYAEVRDCRRQYLLSYFGEEIEPCGFCDNCRRGLPAAGQSARDAGRPFPIKTRVSHASWGKGLVEGYHGNAITVLFDEVGEKTLALDRVLEQGLLQKA